MTTAEHGDNGAGLGASHQTGWTGTVAKLIQVFGALSAEDLLAGGRRTAFQAQTGPSPVAGREAGEPAGPRPSTSSGRAEKAR